MKYVVDSERFTSEEMAAIGRYRRFMKNAYGFFEDPRYNPSITLEDHPERNEQEFVLWLTEDDDKTE